MLLSKKEEEQAKDSEDPKDSEEPTQADPSETSDEPAKKEEIVPLFLNVPGLSDTGPDLQEETSVILYGDIDEENSSEIIISLLKRYSILSKVQTEESSAPPGPINFYLSSYGGSAADMFAIYDIVNMVKQKTNIHTFGIGKVMSAGVVLLAAGTEGERRIGRNCRIMLHGVVSGYHGHLHNLTNEIEEAKWIQERYIDALVANSNMTKKYIKKLIDRKVNVYIDAKEAVELGIADKII